MASLIRGAIVAGAAGLIVEIESNVSTSAFGSSVKRGHERA
jgi:hypothetical protein